MLKLNRCATCIHFRPKTLQDSHSSKAMKSYAREVELMLPLESKHVDNDVDEVAKSLEGGCNAVVYYRLDPLALIGNEIATGDG